VSYEYLKRYATERELEYIAAIEQHGTQRAAAEALGVGRTAVSQAMKAAALRAAKRGLSPDHDMTHPAAPGFSVSGTSTMYGPDGDIKAQWVKTRQDQTEIVQQLLETLENYEFKPVDPIQCQRAANEDLCTLYTITDFHLGMYAWAAETGDDWDLEIATREFVGAIQEMVEGSPDSEFGILNIQGDFLHWDGLDAVTPTSRHIVDADTRFAKLVEMSLDVIMASISLLLVKHEKVKVLICEGNHDLVGSLWIRKAIKKIYIKNPRIEIDDTEFPFYAHLHGNIMLGFHHGHKVKNKSLPALFSSEPRFRKMWGLADYCYIHTGHYHQTEQDMAEAGGAIVERHPTLSSRDAYASRGGYVSWRAAHAITYHKDYGEYRRVTVTPKMRKEDGLL